MFSANLLEEECLRYVPSVARLVHVSLCKVPCYGSFFRQAAMRCYDTTSLLSVSAFVFLGYLFWVAPR